MSNLPNLPLFENSIKPHKDNHGKSPANLNLPDLENESFSNQLHEDFESDLMLTGELAKEYKKIKDSYRKLIYTFEKSLQKDMTVINDNETRLKDYKFKSLSDFENAVNKGVLNLEYYNSKEINDLIKELNELENRLITRDLNEYNFKTLDDFQIAVDKGIIDLSRYEMKEITELLNKLEDEPLKLSDYDIVTFGNVKLSQIEYRINKPRKPKETHHKNKKEILNEINVYKGKKASLPTPPKNTHKNIKKRDKLTEVIESNENIDEILEGGFISRFVRKIKNTFSKKQKDL